MHERLTDLFRRREIDKRYWAMVKGVPEPRQGIVNIPLAEVELGDGRHRMTGKWMIYEFHLSLDCNCKVSAQTAIVQLGGQYHHTSHAADFPTQIRNDQVVKFEFSHSDARLPRLQNHIEQGARSEEGEEGRAAARRHRVPRPHREQIRSLARRVQARHGV